MKSFGKGLGISVLGSFFMIFIILLIGLFFVTLHRMNEIRNWEPKTMCIDGITYYEAQMSPRVTSRKMRKEYPTWNIYIKDGKVVRCD